MPTTYLQITPDRIAPDVILVGDPARARLAAGRLERITFEGKNREYHWFTGTVPATGKPVTVAACGIGAPAWAIALTELHACGARRFVRVGTVLSPSLPLGTVALARSALRYDRVSEDYLPLHVPVLPDPRLTASLRIALEQRGVPVEEVLFASFSTFYGEMEPLFDGQAPAATASFQQARFHDALALGARAVDMETAAVLAFARCFGAMAASACLCTVAGNGGPILDGADRQRLEETLIDGVFRALGDIG